MKIIKKYTALHVMTAEGDVKHAIVKTVTNQDAITVSVGHAAAQAATREVSTKTRGTIFTIA
jgi:hypothetical protein